MIKTFYPIVNYFSPIVCTKIAQTVVPSIAISFGFYFMIMYPQQKQKQHSRMIELQLHPGVVIKTANNIEGTVIAVTKNSAVIECMTGQKIEVLMQTIISINTKKN